MIIAFYHACDGRERPDRLAVHGAVEVRDVLWDLLRDEGNELFVAVER